LVEIGTKIIRYQILLFLLVSEIAEHLFRKKRRSPTPARPHGKFRVRPGVMEPEHANGICFAYDVLVDVLRRLPVRALAVCQCVCRAWRGIVDAHTLLFPREFGGIFAAYYGYDPDFALFAPPAASRDGADQPPSYRRLFSVDLFSNVQQHCNGLFLVTGHHKFRPVLVPSVYNPATSRYARLPRPPGPWPCSVEGMFLAFDPAVSRHHEVIFLRTENLTPRQIRRQRQRHIQIQDKGPSWIDLEDPFLRDLFDEEQLSKEKEDQHESHAEEPCQINLGHPFLHNLFGKEQTPKEEQHESHSRDEEPAGSASYESNVPEVEVPKEKVLHGFVFSSQTGQWKRQEFTPGRCAPADLYDVVTAPRGEAERTWWSVEYCRGSLYVHCHSGILMILHCSEGTYDMVQLPVQPDKVEYLYRSELPMRCLTSYERKIRYVVLNMSQLQLWELAELVDGQLGWTLVHEVDLEEHARKIYHIRKQSRMQPRMTWKVVVESTKDLVSLFGHGSNKKINVDGDDETKKNVEEEEDGGIEEENKLQDEEDEEQDNAKETQGEEEEEQHSDGDEASECSDYSWDSNDHNFINFDNNAIAIPPLVWDWGCSIVGFHPYKDVLLLKFSDTVVAYHLKTSRMQYLGYIYPKQYHQHARDVHAVFPYRPCYIDALPPRRTS
jgi:hypothetical protein